MQTAPKPSHGLYRLGAPGRTTLFWDPGGTGPCTSSYGWPEVALCESGVGTKSWGIVADVHAAMRW
jgi:hypothetical protein